MTNLTPKRKKKFIGTFGRIILKRKKEEKIKIKACKFDNDIQKVTIT